MWSERIVTKPVAKPLELPEVLEHAKIRPEEAALQQVLLNAAIEVARMNCEAFTKRQLIDAELELWLDTWWEEHLFSEGSLFLPKPPLRTVVSVKYLDEAGNEQTLNPAKYRVDVQEGPELIAETCQRGRLWLKSGETWPATRCEPAAIKIRFTAGYGGSAAKVPEPLREGMRREVTEMYNVRGISIVGAIVNAVVLDAQLCWAPFVVPRLKAEKW